MENPSRHITAMSIFDLYRQSLQQAKPLLAALCRNTLPPEEPAIRTALSHSLLTPESALSNVQNEWLAVLQR
jgi:hypothetical protein